MSSKDNRFRNRNAGVTASATVKYAGGAATPKASFNRPANVTLYDVGDTVANNVAAGSVVPLTFAAAREFASSFFIQSARLTKTGQNAANAVFWLHLFEELPTPVSGDGGPFQSNKAAAYLGGFEFSAMRAFSDGCCAMGVPLQDAPIVVELAEGVRTIYGLLEVRGAYAPNNSEKFEVTLGLQQD